MAKGEGPKKKNLKQPKNERKCVYFSEPDKTDKLDKMPVLLPHFHSRKPRKWRTHYRERRQPSGQSWRPLPQPLMLRRRTQPRRITETQRSHPHRPCFSSRGTEVTLLQLRQRQPPTASHRHCRSRFSTSPLGFWNISTLRYGNAETTIPNVT